MPPTRRESPGSAGSTVLAPGALPSSLQDRMTEVAPMPAQGGEADLFRVRDTRDHDRELVLKVYRAQLRPDAEVWHELTSVRSPHIVEVVETGRLPDGRFFELMEYLPEGNMRGLSAGREVFAPERITEVVRQLGSGLAALHDRGITHRDLKPDNVLVRSVEPLQLVLTDFGLSRRLDHSMVFSTDARTSAYAAPEAYSTHVSPARDWWSLGIMILELATGVRPFHGLDELMIQKAVTTKPVPVDAVTNPRLNRLCSGLLVSDPAKRWGWEQVESWLAGGAPPVPDRRVPVDVRAFAFADGTYLDPESLAVAMANQWPAAARRFFVVMGEAWQSLKIWLRQFDDPEHYPPSVVAARQELLDGLEASAAAPNVKLLYLLTGLNPTQPPIYRQAHIDATMLRSLARTALDGDPATSQTRKARDILDEFWNDRLLQVLARFDGAADLASIDDRWQDCLTAWERAAADLAERPELTGVFAEPDTTARGRAAMLEIAAGVDRGPDWIEALHKRGAVLPAPIAWYADLLGWVGSDPVRAFAAWCASGVAQAQAEQVVRERQAAEQAERMRDQVWREQESLRLQGRSAAMGTALGGLAAAALIWLLLCALSSTSSALLGAIVTVILVQVTTELSLAYTLGTDYHPRFSLSQAMGGAAGRLGNRIRNNVGLAVVVIITLVIINLFVLPIVLMVALIAAVAQALWAAFRYQQWSQIHQQKYQEAMLR